MSLPRGLSINIQKFQQASKSQIRIQAQKTSFADKESIIFTLPSQGIIDLQSLTMAAKLSLGTVATTMATNTNPLTLSGLCSKIEWLAGGQVIYGSTTSDMGLCRRIVDRLFKPNYLLKASNTLYEHLVPTQTTGTLSPWLLMGDALDPFRNVRYLNLSAMPQVEIRVTIDLARWAPNVGTITGTQSVSESYLMATKLDFQNDLYSNIISERLNKSPIELITTDFALTQGSAFTTGTVSVPFQISSASLDYVVAFNRLAAATGATYYDTNAAMTAATIVDTCTHQLFVNGTPLTSFPLRLHEVFWNTNFVGLEGGSDNFAVDYNATSVAEFADTRFAYVHKFAFDAETSEEKKSLVSGMSSYGSVIPMQYQITGATLNAANVPYIMCIMSKIVELHPGKQITLVQ